MMASELIINKGAIYEICQTNFNDSASICFYVC
jgi:hypothetical protein